MEHVLAGTTSLTEYREIDEVLRSPNFVQAAYGPAVQPLVHDTLTAIDGPRHAARWRLESRLFGRDGLATYKREAVEPLLRKVLAELADQGGPDGDVRTDLVPVFWSIARRIPAFVVGIDGVEDGARIDRFVELLSTLGHGFSASLSPHGDELIERALAARATFAEEFFEPSAARRRALIERFERGEIGEDALPRDLITLLLRHPEPDADATFMVREAAVFLSASITTTAQFFPHFVVRVLDWADRHPDRRDRLVDLDWLQRAVGEALRFIVASPARLRRATADVQLSSGRRIAAGETVSLWFLPANQDTGLFGADADRFDPDRDTGRRPAWGLAFGQGAHLCIGRNLITGISNRTPDPGGATNATSTAYGVIATVAQALFEAGMTLDPERPPAKHPTSIYDEYVSLPVRLTMP